MVLLSASICTKSGKALVARQFMEITRSRVEGLLAAFPKLLNTDEQHTFVETENVRYVYQPLENLYVVLITTKNSNILEDLETLRLFAKVIPEYCKVMSDREVCDRAFELIFAFDEIVSLGYREQVNLSQIKTFTEMDSHDENMARMIQKNKEREAQETMKRKAKELKLQRRDNHGGTGGGFGGGGGFGSGGGGSESHGRGIPASNHGHSEHSSYTAPTSTSMDVKVQNQAAPAKKAGRGMKLGGSKTPKTDDFVEALRAEGQEVASVEDNNRGVTPRSPVKAESGSLPLSKAAAIGPPKESVHIRVEEKITLEASRDGGLETMEVKGIMQLLVSEQSVSKVRIAVNKSEDKVPFQTHPNVDKKLFSGESLIGLKNADKSFPLDSEVGVLKWRFTTTDEGLIPLTINCWPNVNADGSCDVNIDYELTATELELTGVTFSIPCPPGSGAPVVKTCDGEYQYNSRGNVLEWRVPIVDADNTEGSLEFSMKAALADDFFPVSVAFTSSKTYAGLEINNVVHAETGASIPFSQDVVFSVDKYHII